MATDSPIEDQERGSNERDDVSAAEAAEEEQERQEKTGQESPT